MNWLGEKLTEEMRNQVRKEGKEAGAGLLSNNWKRHSWHARNRLSKTMM